MDCFIGFDIGGTSIKLGALDSNLRVLCKDIVPVDTTSPENSIRTAWSKSKRLCTDKGCNPIAAGIACPGPIDFATSTLGKLPNLPLWNGFNLLEFSREIMSIPVCIENDANVAALAEATVGAGIGSRMLILVTLGTGVGGGIVSNGDIIRGAFGGAGEIGHIPVHGNSIKCGCGNTGCLETLIGKMGIIRNYNSRVPSFKVVQSIPDIQIRMRANEENAINCFKWVGETLGFALSSTVNLLNPDYVLIGGGISSAGEILVDSVCSQLTKYVMPSFLNKLQVKLAKLGNDAGFVGAAILARKLSNVLPD